MSGGRVRVIEIAGAGASPVATDVQTADKTPAARPPTAIVNRPCRRDMNTCRESTNKSFRRNRTAVVYTDGILVIVGEYAADVNGCRSLADLECPDACGNSSGKHCKTIPL